MPKDLLPIPVPPDEVNFWLNSREILHFVGICGAGKSTLASRLAKRCQSFGSKAIGTIDYDPHTPDHERIHERAFSRALDHLNNQAGRIDSSVHRQIVDHSVMLVKSWQASDANVVLVDRWYESYDNLPQACRLEIEEAIQRSGFRLRHINLLVGAPNSLDDSEAIRQRLLHTKERRPASWWDAGPETLEQWVQEESAYQDEYRTFCAQSIFPVTTLYTTSMNWDELERDILFHIQRDQWVEAFDAWWRTLTNREKDHLRTARLQPCNQRQQPGMMPPRPGYYLMLDQLPRTHEFWGTSPETSQSN